MTETKAASVLLLLLCAAPLCTSTAEPAPPLPIPAHEKEAAFWRQQARETLQSVLGEERVVGVAKNVILFLGDGMGVSTVTAARILKGQLEGGLGEEATLSFDNFPYVGLSRTYSVDYTVTDSASSATAYQCGVKANSGTMGVTAKVTKGDCRSMQGGAHNVTSVLRWFLNAGRSAGIVTTTRVTHATPGAAYSHTASRDWEGDSMMDGVTGGCKDIALQLVEDNSDINVIMGGGRYYFLPNHTADPEYGLNATAKLGRRDNRNLIDAWLRGKRQRGEAARYVWNLTDFQAVDPDSTDFLLGLFEADHMKYELERSQDKAGEPSLEEMTDKAIRILKRQPKGFFLLVEGGRIDHGHHANRASMALHDAVMFAKAVSKAVQLTSAQDTLIVVTADHSHTFVLGGYSTRGNPILGLENHLKEGTDHLPFVSLLYGNGPGYRIENNMRRNLTGVNTTGNEFLQPAGVPLRSETHGGEDVAIYARGPMAHLYVGVHQQNYIPHVMAYAACLGDYSRDSDCARSLLHPSPSPPHTNAAASPPGLLLARALGLACSLILVCLGH